jgi:hypothetical protein
MLLFCVASGTDWQRAGVTGETVTALVVRGLIERDAKGRLALTDDGLAALRALLPGREGSVDRSGARRDHGGGTERAIENKRGDPKAAP